MRLIGACNILLLWFLGAGCLGNEVLVQSPDGTKANQPYTCSSSAGCKCKQDSDCAIFGATAVCSCPLFNSAGVCTQTACTDTNCAGYKDENTCVADPHCKAQCGSYKGTDCETFNTCVSQNLS